MSRNIRFGLSFVILMVFALSAMPAFAQIATPPPTLAPEGPPPIAQITIPEYVKTGETMEVEVEAIGFIPGSDVVLSLRLSKDNPVSVVSETPISVKASADPETAGIVRFRQNMTAPEPGPYHLAIVYNGEVIGDAPFYSQPLDAFDTAGPLPANGTITLTQNTDATPNMLGECGMKYWGLWKFTVSKQTLLTLNAKYQNPLYQYFPCVTLFSDIGNDFGVVEPIYRSVDGEQSRMLLPGDYWIGVEGDEDTVLLNNQSFELTDREIAILAWQEIQQGGDWREELFNDQYILHALADALKPYLNIPEGVVPTKEQILAWVAEDPSGAQRVLTAILADPGILAQLAAVMPTPPALLETPPAPIMVPTFDVNDPAFQAAVQSEVSRQLAEGQKPTNGWKLFSQYLEVGILITVLVIGFFLLRRWILKH